MKGWFRPSVWGIVAVNLIPVAGVIWLSWSVFDVVASYWLETLVVCLFTFLKILGSQEPVENPEVEVVYKNQRLTFSLMNKGMYAAVFIQNSLGILAAHFVFIVLMFQAPSLASWTIADILALPQEWFYFATALLISHGYSFLVNYCINGEYLSSSPKELMVQPYRRVAAMMLTLIVGGWLIDRAGAGTWVVVALISCKLVIDIFAHLEEHHFLNTSNGDDIVTQAIRKF